MGDGGGGSLPRSHRGRSWAWPHTSPLSSSSSECLLLCMLDLYTTTTGSHSVVRSSCCHKVNPQLKEEAFLHNVDTACYTSLPLAVLQCAAILQKRCRLLYIYVRHWSQDRQLNRGLLWIISETAGGLFQRHSSHDYTIQLKIIIWEFSCTPVCILPPIQRQLIAPHKREHGDNEPGAHHKQEECLFSTEGLNALGYWEVGLVKTKHCPQYIPAVIESRPNSGRCGEGC